MSSKSGTAKKIITAVVCFLLIIGIIAASLVIYRKKFKKEVTVEAVSVQSNSVGSEYMDTDTVYGTTVAENKQSIYPESDKSVQEIYVKEGDSVKIGDKLIQYDTTMAEMDVESAEIANKKLDIQIDKAKEKLAKLKNTTPSGGGGGGDDPDPEPDPTEEPTEEPSPTPQPVGTCYKRVTLESVPYMGDGSSENPYRILITEDAVVRKEFIEKVYGFAEAGSTAEPETTEEPEATVEPEATAEPTPEAEIDIPTEEPEATAEPTVEPESSPEPAEEPSPSPEPESSEESSASESSQTESIDDGAEEIPISSASGALNITSGSLKIAGTLLAKTGTKTATPSPTEVPVIYTPVDGNVVDYSEPFAVVFEVRVGYTERGELVKSWFLDGLIDEAGFFDEPEIIEDEESEAEDDDSDDYSYDYSDYSYYSSDDSTTSYTADELAEAIEEAETNLAELENSRKQGEIDYKKAKLTLDNLTVTATVEGTVISLMSEEDAESSASPMLVVSGGTGIYIKSTISENMLGTVNVGDSFTAESWTTGQTYNGTIVKISEYPTTSDNYSDSSSNSSSYEFTGVLDDSDDLDAGEYLEVKFDVTNSDSKFYLSRAYIRSDTAGHYVYKVVDGVFKKTYIKTGEVVWDEYIAVEAGLKLSDYIAFPYNDDLADGVKAVDSDGKEITS